MFTGIVDHFGTIQRITPIKNGSRFTISCKFADIELGESICVDGACLTALAANEPNCFDAEVSPETLTVTKAGFYKEGAVVNLERSLRPMDRLGGHWVTGHIDQTGRLEKLEPCGEFTRLFFGGIQAGYMRYLIKKGSVAINGVSLTINDLTPDGFAVMLIPHTLERTNLSTLRSSDPVNFEFDWMVKVVLQEASRLSLISKPLTPRGGNENGNTL